MKEEIPSRKKQKKSWYVFNLKVMNRMALWVSHLPVCILCTSDVVKMFI